mgnify:CR=1 FL=1
MKNKKHVWVAGAMCVLPLMGMAQQTEPLTDSRRLFDDGKELFLRRDYAAAQQTLSRFVQQKPQASLADESAYMIACTSYELKSPDCIKQLEGYLEQYPDSRYANRVQSLIASSRKNIQRQLLVLKDASSICWLILSGMPVPCVWELLI